MNNLQKWRKYRGHTQKELSEIANVSIAMINLIETKDHRPNFRTALKLADALETTVSKIFN